MNRARYTSILVILTLLASLISWPQGQAITPQDQTISIIDTHDDKFITEAGIGIDAWLCHILDPDMDIRSYLVFRDLEINWWEPLENATLRLRTTVDLDFDADSSVTIYGMKYSDIQDEGVITPSWVMSVPYTSAYVNVNTSQFYGQVWHEINVTAIVEELIRSYEWDGDGIGGTETGDSIGFVIIGPEGQDTRWFIDYHYGTPSLASQLVIHWNHEPPPPAGEPDAIFNSTYRGYHIWNMTYSEEEWLNYSTFTLINPDNNIQNLNDTYFVYTAYYEDDDDYLRRDFSGSGILRRKFGMTYTNFHDNTPGESGLIVVHWAISKETNAWDQWTESYNLVTQQGTQPTEEWIRLYVINGGVPTNVGAIHNSLILSDLPVTFWIDVIINLDNGDYNVTTYNDWQMTSLNFSKAGTFGDYPDALDLQYEYAMAPSQASSSYRDYESGLRHSIFFETYTIWIVTDENGTTIADDLDDFDDAIIVIEDELGADPEDPDPPGEEWSEGPGGETGAFTRFRMRLWFLLIGFGCLFGPVLFFARRRPSGYYIMCGAIVMLIGIGMLLSIGQV